MACRLPALAWLALLIVGCVGCGTPADGPPDLSAVPVPHNWNQINEIIQPSCANFSVCHSPEGKRDAKVSFKGTADQAWTALVGVPAKIDVPPLLLVKPCDPEHSFLYMKLKLPVTATDPKDGYGEHMPKGNPSLPDEQLLGIHDWIARGAHRNEPDTVTGNTCQVEDMGMPDLGTPPDLSATPPDLATPADLANPDALPKG